MKNKSLLLCGLIPVAVVAAPMVASAEVTHAQEIIDRPRTNPASQLTVGGDLGFAFEPTRIGLGVLTRYGVSDALEVGASYGFSLKDFEAKGNLGVEIAFGVINSGNLQLAPQASVGYSFLSEGLTPLGLGARFQLKLDDKMAIYSSGNQLVIWLDKQEVNVPPLPVVEFQPMYLHVPVGFGFQASSNLWAFIETDIATIEIQDADTGFIFADRTPLSLGAFFSPSNTMDLGGSLNWGDIIEDAGGLGITASARLHL